MRRTWVAQAGESAETVSSPASKDSGFVCRASSAYRGPFPPAARRQEAADGRGEPLWIVASWPCRPGQGRCAFRSQALSF
jgi:hypothetical protein